MPVAVVQKLGADGDLLVRVAVVRRKTRQLSQDGLESFASRRIVLRLRSSSSG